MAKRAKPKAGKSAPRSKKPPGPTQGSGRIPRRTCAATVWTNRGMEPCSEKPRLYELNQWWCSEHAPSVAIARAEAAKGAKRGRAG